MRYRHDKPVLALVMLVLGLAACSGGGTTSPEGQGGQTSGGCAGTTDMTFRLNWTVDYEQVPYYVAKDKGYYKSQCLNVTLQPGRGSSDTATLVGSGTAQVGVADTVAVMQAQVKGLPLTGTAVVWRNNAFAVVVRNDALKGKTNPQPKDLEGLTFGAVTSGSPYIFWKAFAHQQHLDASKIKEVGIAAPGYAEMAQGSVDFLANFASAKIDLEAKGVPVTILSAANFGQQGYGLSIFANNDWLKDHNDAMKGFLAATAQGMAWSANHPEEALAVEAKTNPALTQTADAQKANLAGFKTDASLWATGTSLGKGQYLTFDDNGLKQTEQILYDGAILTGSPADLSTKWTPKFLPDTSVYQQYQQAG
jgi:NitT/TauT family transport system substrate-binding protein